MILKDGMTLYHGSYTAVKIIELKMCSDGKDFGKGFYMTSNLNQARNFIPTSLLKAKSEELMPDHLDDQYCFLTEKAIGCLEFKEAIKYAIR